MFLRKINFVVFMLKIRRMFEFECVVIFIESPFIRRNCLINLESIKWWNILHSRKLIVDLCQNEELFLGNMDNQILNKNVMSSLFWE